MNRSLSQPFVYPPLAKLTQQLLYAPPEKRIEQVRRAERFHDEIDPDRDYPFEYVNFRITAYRTEQKDENLMRGGSIQPDLRLMIDSLTRSVPIPVTDDEPVESVEELAQRLNVSTKTITRWRKVGLRWRWVVTPGSTRRHIAMTKPAVERFLAQHRDKIQRASRFSQMDPAARRSVVDRAKKIAQSRDFSLNQVATHIAARLGRAQETIRVILEQHERNHPANPIFARRTGPLNAKQKRVIDRAYRIGIPISRIAHRFGRTASTIYRIVRQRRAAALRAVPIRYVHSPLFDRDDADEVLLRSADQPPLSLTPTRPVTVPAGPAIADIPEPLKPLYWQPAIAPSDQRPWFVRFNYLKFKAHRLRESLHRYEPRVADLDEIEICLQQARRIQEQLVTGNLAAVLSVVRQHLVTQDDRSVAHLVEMLEIGNAVLLEAVEIFDSSGNRTFPVFLKWKLMQRFVPEQANIDDASKAHRQLDPRASLRRMRDQAARYGITLPGHEPGPAVTDL